MFKIYTDVREIPPAPPDSRIVILLVEDPLNECHQLSYFDKRTPNPPLADDVIYVQPLKTTKKYQKTTKNVQNTTLTLKKKVS